MSTLEEQIIKSIDEHQDIVQRVKEDFSNFLFNECQALLAYPLCIKEDKEEFDQLIQKVLYTRVKSLKSINTKLDKKSTSKDDDNKRKELFDDFGDIVGLRIIVAWDKYEELLHEKIVNKFIVEYEKYVLIDGKDPVKQKNGNTICKPQFIYNEKYKIELQIKSVLHEFWGEIDHKLVYKNEEISASSSMKNTVISGTHDILVGVDKQLEKIYNHDYNDEHFLEMKKELIYNYSCKKLEIGKNFHVANSFDSCFKIMQYSEKKDGFFDKILINFLKNEEIEKKKLLRLSQMKM